MPNFTTRKYDHDIDDILILDICGIYYCSSGLHIHVNIDMIENSISNLSNLPNFRYCFITLCYIIHTTTNIDEHR